MKTFKNIGLSFSLLASTIIIFYACYLCALKCDSLPDGAQKLFFVYAAIFCGFVGVITSVLAYCKFNGDE
jgi:hypothetical protein